MTHASLFSGIGGPEVAAVMLGWHNAFHCDINPFGRSVLEYWFPNSESYGDIKTTDFKKWQGKIDVLTGGFPCQPFSYAGKRRGADDDRYLWPEFKRVITEIRPTWVVGENVAGIASMVEQGEISEMASQAVMFKKNNRVHGYRQEQPFTIERVCSDLESIGYSVQPMLIPAVAVGAPHRRDRVFIIGHFDNADRMGLQGNEKLGFTRKSGNIGAASNDGKTGLAINSECFGRLERSNDNGVTEKTQQKKCGEIEFSRADSTQDRWRNFPTVSPVHRGNDGLPFDVDNLSIPFGKWRTEALKAYGNAIVPQVMYEIFRCIDIIENNI